MSYITPPSQSSAADSAISPRKLELILNPEDGSLQTASLYTIILATTDSLYKDLYNMAHGEIHVTTSMQSQEEDDNAEQMQQQQSSSSPQQFLMGKSDKMSNLSFAQRRHELSWRLASHSKAFQHVAALTAAAATSELSLTTEISTQALQHARTAWVQADEAQDALYFFHAQLFPTRKAPHDVYGALDVLLLKYWPDLPSDIRLTVDRYEDSAEKRWSSKEVSDRWQIAVRSKLLLGEVGFMKQQQQQKSMNIMSPLTSPLSSSRNLSSFSSSVPWKVSLRGGIVRLTHGRPKITIDAADGTTKTLYPLEAILTVLTTNTSNMNVMNTCGDNVGGGSWQSDNNSIDSASKIPPPDSEWTLVSIEVHVQAKTGQSTHQLDTTNKQRFNLHRLCALAMSREEARARKARQKHQQQQQKSKEEQQSFQSQSNVAISNLQEHHSTDCVARPLNALFQVAHSFSLSWQLEVLSAQAQALRKGIWGGTAGFGTTTSTTATRSSSGGQPHRWSVQSSSFLNTSSGAYGSSIVVTPVQFFDNRSILGIVSISFWTVDDRYGSPCVGDLHLLDDDDDDDDEHGEEDEVNDENDMDLNPNNHLCRRRKCTTNSSTADSVSTVSRSINHPSVTNQLTLSIRAEPNVGIRVSLSGAESIMEFASVQPHIRSTIRELLDATSNPFSLSASEALLAATRLCAERKCYAMVQYLPAHLPSWISLQVEKGSIAVAAKIHYFTGNDCIANENKSPVTLFRLACDSRTGSFVPTFSRSTHLLQYLACNDVRAASDTSILRATNTTKFRRSTGAPTPSKGGGGSTSFFPCGRAVRDAFESLSRSMNVLGQRTGVGGPWKNRDRESVLLRDRAIQLACMDVKVSLMTCCGMAALYGLSAVTLGVATGVQASSDMAGGKLETNSAEFLKAIQSVGMENPVASSFLTSPPISLLLDQQLVEHSSSTHDGDRIKEAFAKQQLFGVCCTVEESRGVTLYGAKIEVKLESPSSFPIRTFLSLTKFIAPATIGDTIDKTEEEPPAKRHKVESDPGDDHSLMDLMDEVMWFAEIVSETLSREGESADVGAIVGNQSVLVDLA